MQLGVDLQCLCPYMLTENKGLLVPGNPQLGVVKHHRPSQPATQERDGRCEKGFKTKR